MTKKVSLTSHVTAVSSQERLLFNNFFGTEKCSFYSREVTKRERLLMARVRYYEIFMQQFDRQNNNF